MGQIVFMVARLLLIYLNVSYIYGQNKSDFQEVILKFIEKAEDDAEYINNNYIHRELEINEDFKNGIILNREQRLYQIERRGDIFFKKLLNKDGLEMDSADFQPKKEIVSMNGLLKRFDFTFERSEVLDKEKCFVFLFRPKNKPIEKTKEDRVLNKLTGEVWVVVDSLRFKQLRARLFTKVKFEAIGSGATLHLLDCLVTAKNIDGRIAVEYVQVEYVGSGRLMFVNVINKHGTKKIYYKDYERRKQ